jgi:hypothetical protein
MNVILDGFSLLNIVSWVLVGLNILMLTLDPSAIINVVGLASATYSVAALWFIKQS